SIAFNRSNWRAARDSCAEAERIMLTHHNTVVWEINAIRVWLFGSLAMLGEMNELNTRLPGLTRDARKRGDRLALDVFETSLCTLAPLARDAPREVYDAIRRDVVVAERIFSSPSYHRLVGLALASFYESNYQAAWQEIDRAWRAIHDARFLQLE